MRRLATLLLPVLVLTVAWAPVTMAQGSDIAESLCKALSRKEVRQALGTRTHVPRPEPDYFYCSWRPESFDEPEITLNVQWSDYTLDQMRQLLSDPTQAPVDLVVGGHPALYAEQSGLANLYVDLEPGVLLLSLDDRVERDWQALLTGLGERAVTRADALVRMPPIDATLAASFPTAVGNATVIMVPEYVRRAFLDRDRRRAFRDAVEAAGKTFADVSLANATVRGPAGEEGPRIFALRVPGTDAAAFVDFAVHQSLTVAPDPLANGEVGYVADSGGDPTYVTYVYPKDDVVWTVYGKQADVAQVLPLLPGAPAPRPIPTPTPAPTPDISTPEGYLTSLLPATVSGDKLRIQVYKAEDALTPVAQKSFRPILKGQGKTIADLVIVLAFNALGSQIQGIQIVGGDAAPLEEVVLEQMRSGGIVDKKTKPQPVEIAGKAMRSITTSAGDAHLYPKDDVMWVVMASDEAALTEIFTALP